MILHSGVRRNASKICARETVRHAGIRAHSGRYAIPIALMQPSSEVHSFHLEVVYWVLGDST